MQWFLYSVLTIAALMYIGGPLLVYFTQKMEGRPRFTELDESQLPADLTQYLYRMVEDIRKESFIPEAYLMADTAANVSAYLVMLVNRETGDKAMVTVLVAAGGVQVAPYVEYSTRYHSGKSVDTLNSNTIGSFEPTSNEYKTYAWNIKDPRRLYRIHRHVIAKHAGIAPDDETVVYPRGEALPYLLNVMQEGYEAQVKSGLLRREGTGNEAIYRPTLVGAFRITYRNLPPFIGQLRERLLAHANKILRSYEESERSLS